MRVVAMFIALLAPLVTASIRAPGRRSEGALHGIEVGEVLLQPSHEHGLRRIQWELIARPARWGGRGIRDGKGRRRRRHVHWGSVGGAVGVGGGVGVGGAVGVGGDVAGTARRVLERVAVKCRGVG